MKCVIGCVNVLFFGVVITNYSLYQLEGIGRQW
jgi:hypothetical protein